MAKLFVAIQNILVFFFVWAIVRKAILIGGGLFFDELGAAVIFGILAAFTPNVLKFFKLPVNHGSKFLIMLILTFVYLFLQISVFNVINITGQPINLGIDLIGPIELEDKTYALVLLSGLLSSLSALLDFLKKK